MSHLEKCLPIGFSRGKKSRAGTWYPVSEIPLQIFCWHKILAKVCNLNAFYFMGVVRGGPHCRRGVKIFVKLMLQQLNLSCSSANFLHHHTKNDIVMQVDRPKKEKSIEWVAKFVRNVRNSRREEFKIDANRQ